MKQILNNIVKKEKRTDVEVGSFYNLLAVF